jgi:hypothetical protein
MAFFLVLVLVGYGTKAGFTPMQEDKIVLSETDKFRYPNYDDVCVVGMGAEQLKLVRQH